MCPAHILRRALLGLWLACTAAAGAQDRLPPMVARELEAAGIPVSAVSVLVQAVDEAQPRLALNSRVARSPASLMKLLTTYAALDLLGPGYTWKTEAYIDSPLTDGALSRDLFLKGGGDPRLTQEQFWLLLRQIRARGVRDIGGDLVLDRSAFALRTEDVQAFDDQPLRPYNVAPDALLVNFKSLRLTLVPRPALGSVDIVPEYRLDRLDIVNLVKLGPGECGEWKESLKATQSATAHGERLVLEGTYPAACGERDWHLSVLSNAEFVDAMFRDQWRELGGRISGGVRDGVVPFNAQLLASVESPPLAQVVRDINKYSNNVMARQLYLTLGLEAGRRPAGTAEAESVIRAWLAVKRLSFPELVLENGAGLSRRERIAATSLEQLLNSAWNSPLMPELVSSLPLAAIDGTMQSRLGESRVRGQAHIKTGSLEGVRAIAGYVRARSGKYFIAIFIVNHPAAAASRAAQDALLQWAYLLPGRP